MAEFIRAIALDDIRIRSGGSGRTVEAYAAVFEQEAEIVDADGHYLETNAPDAFNRTIERHRGRFPVVYHHGMTIAGTPSERGSVPIGVSVEVKADKRGVLTVSEYGRSELADDVLEGIKVGAIAGQSYGGAFLRSSPTRPRGGFRRQGDGRLPVVRRHVVAMREFGPTPFPAFTGAAILGVRAGALADLAALRELGYAPEHDGDAFTLGDEDTNSPAGTPTGHAQRPDDDTPPPERHSHRSKADALLADIRRARIIRGLE